MSKSLGKQHAETRVSVLLTSDQYRDIMDEADRVGLGVSAYLRNAALEKARASIPLRGEVR